jgi:hypothetical protein
MRLPGHAGWHAAFAEQPLGNGAIGLVGQVCIKRTEGKRQSLAS